MLDCIRAKNRIDNDTIKNEFVAKLSARANAHAGNADRVTTNIHEVTSKVMQHYIDSPNGEINQLRPQSGYKAARIGVIEHHVQRFYTKNAAAEISGKNPQELFGMFESQGYAKKVGKGITRGQAYHIATCIPFVNSASAVAWFAHTKKYAKIPV
jgi:hypothetical protein